MTEYIITSEQLIEVFDKLHSWDFPEWLHEFVYTRKLFCPKLPEIVRCRDCKYMHTVRHWLGMDVDECWLHADRESGALGKEPTEPDGFCKWGERRDE